MDRRKIARYVAQRYAQLVLTDKKKDKQKEPYEPKDAVDKMIGETVKQQLGIDDAPALFFVRVKARLREDLGGEVDLDDDKTYPAMLGAVIDTAQAMDMIEDKSE